MPPLFHQPFPTPQRVHLGWEQSLGLGTADKDLAIVPWNVVNGSEKKPPVTSSSSTTSIAGSCKAEIEASLDRDSRPHAFLVFNIKQSVACQFEDTNEEATNELWAAIKNMYHIANHAQMIAIESQLANIKIHDTLNIMDQITQFLLSKSS